MAHQRFHQNFRAAYSERGIDPGVDIDLARVVKAGPFIFLQGQSGRDLDGNFVGGGDAGAQAENAMNCVRILLEDAGASMDDICKITTYLTDSAYRKPVYNVLAKHLKGVYPVSTGLVVKELGQPDMLMEIDVFAVLPME